MVKDLFDRGGWIEDMDLCGEGCYREALRHDGSVVKVFKDRGGNFHDVHSGETYSDLAGWRYPA